MDCNMKRLITIASICILALASCIGPHETDFDFSLDRDECRFAADSGQSYFRVFGQGRWTAAFEQEVDWVSLDKMEGMGESQVLVFHKKNEGLSRGVNLYIDHEDGTRKTIYMSQKSGLGSDKPAYSLAAETLNLLKMSMKAEVAAVSNISAEAVDSAHVKVIYAGEDTTWLSEVTVTPEKVAFSAAANDTGAERTAKIQIAFNGAVWAEPYTIFLNIVQGGAGPEVSLDDSYDLDPLGTKTLEISASTNWNTSLYSYDLSDFSISDKSFLRSVEYIDSIATVRVLPSMNKTKDTRTTTLTWHAKDSKGDIVSTASTTLSQSVSPIWLDGDPVNLTEGGKYANCYILPQTEATYYCLEPKLVSGVLPSEDIADAKLLWQTAENVLEYVAYSPLEGVIYIYKPAGAKGSAIVSLTDEDGKIVWSLHFWASGEAVGECTIGGVTFMDRNIGATAATPPANKEADASGMFYQWGRKDPFPHKEIFDSQKMAETYPANMIEKEKTNEGISLETSIQNPCKIIFASDYKKGSIDWTSEPDVYWNTESKTDYDPCPFGYTVPSQSDMTIIGKKYKSAETSTYGKIITCDDGSTNYWCAPGCYSRNEPTTDKEFSNNNDAYYWTSTPDDKNCSYYFQNGNVNSSDQFGRQFCIAVRCVKANNQ